MMFCKDNLMTHLMCKFLYVAIGHSWHHVQLYQQPDPCISNVIADSQFIGIGI
uniref:Uncharacterized protein n=1 Tax=Arundo donax TaxID=35708 RepID=A0A0A9GUT7_ARUDO